MLRQLVAFLSATVLAGAAWGVDYKITGICMGRYACNPVINNSGQIAGDMTVTGGATHGFIYSAGALTDLGTAGSGYSVADINDSGTVLFEDTSFYNVNSHAQGKLSFAGSDYTQVSRLANNGTVMGNYSNCWSNDRDGCYLTITRYGVSVSNGVTTPLPQWAQYVQGQHPDDYPGDDPTYSQANDISDSGQIVGVCYGFENSGACTWINGHITYLSGLSVPQAINAGGKIAGIGYVGWEPHMLIWDNGTVTDWGTPGVGKNLIPTWGSKSWSMNDSGIVVGNASINYWQGYSNVSFPFVAIDGAIRDLNTLLPAGSGWTLDTVNDINDLGQIVGTGYGPDGKSGVFLLEPVPEPASMLLLLAGSSVLLRRRAAK